MTTKVIGIKEFRTNITSLWKKARKQNVNYIVMYHSQPILNIRPIHDEEFILEKLAADIQAARQQAKHGQLYSQAEVRRQLGL